MAATQAQIDELRLLVAEPTTDTFSDAQLTTLIESCPKPDANGLYPEVFGWQPSYDIWGAAAEVWEYKAATEAMSTDFNADRESFSRSQRYEHCVAQARHARARTVVESVLHRRDRQDDILFEGRFPWMMGGGAGGSGALPLVNDIDLYQQVGDETYPPGTVSGGGVENYGQT